MVVMDESERNLLALTASSLMKTPDRMLSCAAALEHVIKSATSEHNEHAAGVYVLDADISAKSLVFACDMVGPERVHVIRNLRENAKLQHRMSLYWDNSERKPRLKDKECCYETKRHTYYRELKKNLVGMKKNIWFVTGSNRGSHD